MLENIPRTTTHQEYVAGNEQSVNGNQKSKKDTNMSYKNLAELRLATKIQENIDKHTLTAIEHLNNEIQHELAQRVEAGEETNATAERKTKYLWNAFENQMNLSKRSTAFFNEIGMKDESQVGGKNASLGEMSNNLTQKGVNIPNGIALTAEHFRRFIEYNQLETKIQRELNKLQFTTNSEGELIADITILKEVGSTIRKMIMDGKYPENLEKEVVLAYELLCDVEKKGELYVAIRSSAIGEDGVKDSFAGQAETELCVKGVDNVLEAVRKVIASVYTDRIISYRQEKNLPAIGTMAIVMQRMIRSDLDGGAAGVMFPKDPNSSKDVTLINGVIGLGEGAVGGGTKPNMESMVFNPLLNEEGKHYRPIISKQTNKQHIKYVYNSDRKPGEPFTITREIPEEMQQQPVLNESEVLELAQVGQKIQEYYEHDVDIEWAKEGGDNKLYIVQSRPETYRSKKDVSVLEIHKLNPPDNMPLVEIARGVRASKKIGSGPVQIINSYEEADKFPQGFILVVKKTDPDWEPIMRKANAIITEEGGPTCHAAIIAREMNIPTIVGCANATKILTNGQEITVSCASGEQGVIYDGIIPSRSEFITLDNIPETKTKIMLNMAKPDEAFDQAEVPNDGAGLIRSEFLLSRIGIHPLALLNFDKLDNSTKEQILAKIPAEYNNSNPREYFVNILAEGLAKMAAACYPNPAVVRLSDFKSNEYSKLLGGSQFEPKEENPMLGFRGASRYYSESYKEAFALECAAMKKVREVMGFTNIIPMVPFCRTLEEADKVLEILAQNGLKRGENGLRVYVMAEVPSNVILAQQFADRFDGFSIGSNDLTQLVLGLDRDSGNPDLLSIGTAANQAVKNFIIQLVTQVRQADENYKLLTGVERHTKIGFCGQQASNDPDYTRFLVEQGLDSISLDPSTALVGRLYIALAELEEQLLEALVKTELEKTGILESDKRYPLLKANLKADLRKSEVFKGILESDPRYAEYREVLEKVK